MKKINTLIISAFPGCGKTYAFKNYKFQNGVLDSDSSEFSWVKDENGNNTKERNPEFPTNYIRHIQDNIGKVDVIFVSSHEVVRDALKNANINYALIYPINTEEVKADFLDRYKKRGNAEPFIEFIDKNWDHFIDQMNNDNFPIKIAIKKDVYINENILRYIFKIYRNKLIN